MLWSRPAENLDKFSVSGVSVRFFMGEGTETLLQDILDARFESRKERINKEVDDDAALG